VKGCPALHVVIVAATAMACSNVHPPVPEDGVFDAPCVDWAIAIHGGAGTMPRDMPGERVETYHRALAAALEAGVSLLDEGASAMDAVTVAVQTLEDDPLFNAGVGAVLCRDGRHHLQAGIMDGRNRAFGGVAAVERIRNPILVARRLADDGPTVFLAGPGADLWAEREGFAMVSNTTFTTEQRIRSLERHRAEAMGTVGAVALDRHGNLAAATSSGGRTGQLPGRVGDVPVVGAGTFADNERGAISGTGKGEQFIRYTVAASIAEAIRRDGLGAEAAARSVVDGVLMTGDGGVIVVAPSGEIAMVYNTAGMYRGAADAAGRFEVGIWEDLTPRRSR
jgi:beta-aspartyl-peptidase (threonine type)